MKTKTILTLVALLSISFSQAQLLDKLKKKAEKAAERTVERRVEKETEKKTDKALDEVFEEKPTKKEKKSSKKESSEKSTSTRSNNEIVTGSNFFPDGQILFTDNFKQDNYGDFPVNWNTNSGGEIIKVNGEKAFKLNPNGTYIAKTSKLPENYALEFDLLTPPYEIVSKVTVFQMHEIDANSQMSTGKRLGFKFEAEDKDIF